MRARRLLECLLILITAPSTLMELGMFAAVQDLLIFFLSTQEGQDYISMALWWALIRYTCGGLYLDMCVVGSN